MAALLLGAWAGCAGGGSGANGGGAGSSGGGTGSASGGGTASRTCMGTHAPCSTYQTGFGAAQACVNHGCTLDNGQCTGTPHTCESVVQGNCGDGHGCNGCDLCGPGKTCVQTCGPGGRFSFVKVTCVTAPMDCSQCSEACAQALCGAGADAGFCQAACPAASPGSFSCNKAL